MRTAIQRLAVLAVALLAALNLGAVPAEASLAWGSCVSGSICFYTERDGQGQRCAWSTSDPDWAGGGTVCSWTGTTVKSVWNNGTGSPWLGVVYYKDANYNSRAGCTRDGSRGNLSGTYSLRSHLWIQSGTCG